MNTLLRDELEQIIAEAWLCQNDHAVFRQRDVLLNAMRRIVTLDCQPTDSLSIQAYLHAECILEARSALADLAATSGESVEEARSLREGGARGRS